MHHTFCFTAFIYLLPDTFHLLLSNMFQIFFNVCIPSQSVAGIPSGKNDLNKGNFPNFLALFSIFVSLKNKVKENLVLPAFPFFYFISISQTLNKLNEMCYLIINKKEKRRKRKKKTRFDEMMNSVKSSSCCN